MRPQDAWLVINDALDWYGEHAHEHQVCRAVGIEDVLWVLPIFGKQERVTVPVATVIERVEQALSVLDGRHPRADEARGFLVRCRALLSS